MHRILLVARRDYLATVRTKGFLIGLVVAPLLFGGSAIGLALLREKPGKTANRIAVLDRTGMAAADVIQAARERNALDLFDKKTGVQLMPKYEFETVAPEAGDPNTQRLALSERVRKGELVAFLEIGAPAIHPGKDANDGKVAYYTNTGGIDEMRLWLGNPVNAGLRRIRLRQLGIDQSHFEDIEKSASLERMSLLTRDEKTGVIQAARKKSELESAVPAIMAVLLGMIVLVGAAPMLTAVSEDKTNRVVEMLLGVATPFDLMMGKVVAAVGVSITSSAFYVAGGTLVLTGMGLVGMAPFGVMPWFFVYLVADVIALCGFAAALGAVCSSPQEAQSLSMLLMSPVMIPPFTPLVMLLRQSAGGVPAWQPWVGLTGVLGWTLLMTFAASRIFRVAILMQGKPPKAAEVLRWAVRG